jgi:hypothetical protein
MEIEVEKEKSISGASVRVVYASKHKYTKGSI